MSEVNPKNSAAKVISQEKMKVLELVEAGKITPEEGLKLLDALGHVNEPAQPIGQTSAKKAP